VVAERDGVVAGEWLFIRRVVLPLCCSLAAAVEVDHRRRLCAADRSARMVGSGATSGPDLPADAGHGSVSPLPEPIYVAFALTLWTMPTITPDQFVVSLVLTVYCLVGPLFKEARFTRLFGEPFTRYQRKVPYWLPWPRRRAAVALPDNVLDGAKPIPTSGQFQDALRAACRRRSFPPR